MLRNCPTCRRLLTTPPGTPCAYCREEEDAAAERIADYLSKGGSATFATVAQATGVRPALLRRLVQNGRIVLSDGSSPSATCSVCGRPLGAQSGRVCTRCAARMRGPAPLRADGAAPAAPAGHRPGGFYSRPGDVGSKPAGF